VVVSLRPSASGDSLPIRAGLGRPNHRTSHTPSGLTTRSYLSHPCGGLLPEARTARVACPAGLEPATTGLEGRCSIQLSYGHADCIAHSPARAPSWPRAKHHALPLGLLPRVPVELAACRTRHMGARIIRTGRGSVNLGLCLGIPCLLDAAIPPARLLLVALRPVVALVATTAIPPAPEPTPARLPFPQPLLPPLPPPLPAQRHARSSGSLRPRISAWSGAGWSSTPISTI